MRILRVVHSRQLPCGCFVGCYEAYDGTTREVIDQVGNRCDIPRHRLNAVLGLALPNPGTTGMLIDAAVTAGDMASSGEDVGQRV